MKESIKIPQMGESVVEATIGTILKRTGSSVTEGEEIIELETEKVNQVLYAPISGILSWKIKPGDTVKMGDVIGEVDGDQQPADKREVPKEEETTPKQRPVTEETSAPTRKGRVTTETFIQELKKPSQREPETIKERAEKEVVEKEGRETRRRMSKIRHTIANRLVDALHTAAILTTFNEVDMSEILNIRSKYQESFKEKYGVKLGLMSFFVKAVVEGLKNFPDFNSYLEKEDIITRQYYDIGIAVGAEKGLVVPVIRNCDALSFAEIEQQIGAYAQKAKDSKLSIGDLEGGGFTITNGGVYGSMLSTPILNPPQVGILGMHKIMKRPMVVNDEIVIRPMMYLALSYDHRLIDGKEAINFLVHIKEVLEDPSRLLFLEMNE